ncbi:MAG: response regulator [Microbacteriaceae bacterium]|nr:response regulator [Microbacteriaceae bacterium]MDR9443454.1 response regulator [Microbacteriaceae bacterium]
MTEKVRILVAEDESLIRLDIVETLKEAGYDVVADAGDGEEALALATEHEPELAVLDVKMPKLDGISVAQKLQEMSIPVVMLTSFSDTDLVQRATEAGAMAYVVKPFSSNDLLPAIQIALSRGQELMDLEAEIADLSERLETRKLLDRAKGLLQIQMKLTEPEAYRWMQKASMDRRLTIAQVAETVIKQLGEDEENS